LMRWGLSAEGHFEATPSVLIQGLAPETGKIDPTVGPSLELFSAAGRRVRLAIAYDGTVAPGQTLRLRPAHSCWLGGAGLQTARSEPDGAIPADPTAPGPWSPVAGGPAEPLTALLQTRDRALWTAAAEAGGG